MHDFVHKTAEFYCLAGMIEPPPITQKEITQWVQEMYLSHILWMMQQRGDKVSQIKRGKLIANTPINLKTDYPYKSFKLNTSGWKYESLATDEPYYINVTIAPESNGGARWMGNINLLMVNHEPPTEINDPAHIVYLLNQLTSLIEHELVHASQSYFSQIGFGLPSKSLRTKRDPYGYLRNPTTNKRLQRPRQTHTLRDIEFYPLILQEINKFKRFVDLKRIVSPDYDINKAVKIFVGLKERERNYLISNVFKKLRQHSPSKWRKAVKELISAL